MNNSVEYAFNAAAWFIGGCLVSSVYWRLVIHRMMRRRGNPKEQPLILFVTFLTIGLMLVSLLFSEAGRIRLSRYISCQAQVQQKNVDTINDSRHSQVILSQNDQDFYNSLKKLFAEKPGTPGVRSQFFKAIDDHIKADAGRISQLQNDPLKPVTTCHKGDAKEALK